MPSDSEAERINREIALEDYRENVSEVAERLKFQVEFSLSALRNLHLVNGGGIVALLTFLGNTGANFDSHSVWWGFFWFAIGLTASLAAYVGAYFSQAHYMNQTAKQAWNAQLRARGAQATYDFARDYALGNRYLYAGIGAAIASLMCFITGAFAALSGL